MLLYVNPIVNKNYGYFISMVFHSKKCDIYLACGTGAISRIHYILYCGEFVQCLTIGLAKIFDVIIFEVCTCPVLCMARIITCMEIGCHVHAR